MRIKHLLFLKMIFLLQLIDYYNPFPRWMVRSSFRVYLFLLIENNIFFLYTLCIHSVCSFTGHHMDHENRSLKVKTYFSALSPWLVCADFEWFVVYSVKQFSSFNGKCGRSTVKKNSHYFFDVKKYISYNWKWKKNS